MKLGTDTHTHTHTHTCTCTRAHTHTHTHTCGNEAGRRHRRVHYARTHTRTHGHTVTHGHTHTGVGMKLGAGIGASPGQNLEQTANKLFQEVQKELDAALSPEDAAFRKQAYEAAMQLRPQEILFELRSAGVDTIGVCVCVCVCV